MVLADASNYFKPMVTSGRFAEGGQDVIELKEDAPEAVIAVLRHIYRFTYKDITAAAIETGVGFHLAIHTTANKYLLPALEAQAISGLREECEAVGKNRGNAKDAGEVFDLIKVLAHHKDIDYRINHQYTNLITTHFPDLFKLQEFRAWLEQPANAVMLQIACKFVEHGDKYAECEVLRCERCGVDFVEVEDTEGDSCCHKGKKHAAHKRL